MKVKHKKRTDKLPAARLALPASSSAEGQLPIGRGDYRASVVINETLSFRNFPMRSAFRLSLLVLAVTAVVAGGCSKKRPAVTAPAPTTAASNAERARLDSIERAESARRAALESARVEAERVAARQAVIVTLGTPVYFELDQADLTEDARALLDAKRDAMQRQSEIRIRIEGHADDTGSDEYNMALGERRAATARRYLVEAGIAEGRIAIVSRGEERPACTDGTEACRSRNRRDEGILVSGL
jgi:peptidoglycan-associated lipoprotein